MPESELLKYLISKFSLGIGLAISFPLTSKPFTIMHKSSIMDFKKCFKEKKIVVYSRKRIKLKHEGGVNIKKCESGNKWTPGSSYQMISRWFSQWATNKHFWILRNVILIAALPQSKIAIPLWKFFIDLSLYANRPFGFSAHASLFLGCLFFIFFIVSLRV